MRMTKLKIIMLENEKLVLLGLLLCYTWHGCYLPHLHQIRCDLMVLTACWCQFIRARIWELLSWIKQIIERDTLRVRRAQLTLELSASFSWKVRNNSSLHFWACLKLWLLRVIQTLNAFEVILTPLEVQRTDQSCAEVFGLLVLSASVLWHLG